MNFYDLSAVTNLGFNKKMSDYEGKVILVVNTASKCGFTPQYDDLEKLYEKYKDQGFEILAFPCNQFGNQEPGNNEEIKSFCTLNYSITFPIFDKVDVNGDNTHPVYKYLKSQSKGILNSEDIKWNFTKFLINKKGEVVKRYAPIKKPLDISKDIEKLIRE
ncbi:MAG: glutathione peroxidase [Thermotogae bacterium]|nr:glutathione peroxidase [Thermotogota bacterium]